MQKCRRSRQHPGEEIEKTGGPKHADRRHQSHQRRQDSSHRFKPRKRPFDKIIKNRAFLKHRKPNDIKQNNRNQVFRECRAFDQFDCTGKFQQLQLVKWFFVGHNRSNSWKRLQQLHFHAGRDFQFVRLFEKPDKQQFHQRYRQCTKPHLQQRHDLHRTDDIKLQLVRLFVKFVR